MKKLLILTIACLLTLSDNIALAGTDSEDTNIPAGKWWQLPKIAEELGLNNEDQKRLDDLFVENRRKMIDLKGNISKEKFEMEQLLEKASINEPECMDRFKKLQDARTNLATERFKFLVETRKILGFDRYQKLKAKFQERQINLMRGRQDFKDSLKKRLFDR